MNSTAEKRYFSALERLRLDSGKNLPPGTPITQSNVAIEAGCCPSALKRSRYPALVKLIQSLNEKSPDEPTVEVENGLRERLELVTAERDALASLLLVADQKLQDLYHALKSEKAS